MLGSIPHQKFCFYHLPTRGRAGIKLGDAWYVSNVSIIYEAFMLYYYLFWMIMGFIIHFYITFGTNLLTGGPTHIAVLLPVSVFWRKGISNGVQTESKRRLGVHVRRSSRRPGDRRAPPYWARPLSRGPLEHPPTDFFRLYSPTYPKNIHGEDRSGGPPPQASVATKNLSGALPGTLAEWEPITGGHHHQSTQISSHLKHSDTQVMSCLE